MPVPKRKTSKQRRNKRSATWGIKPGAVASCLTCQAPLAPHQACKECGYYKGVKILCTKADRLQKRREETRTKEEKTKGAGESEAKTKE